VTKRGAEQVLLEIVAEGLDAVIVNPVYMFGPWDWKPSSGRMILEVARGWALLAPPGGNDFADVRDVAAGILAAARRGRRGRRYILGGEPLSYLDAWRMIAQHVGVRGPRRKMRRPVMFVAGRAGDLWAKIRGVEGDVNSAAVAMSRLEHHYSHARATAELDYRPRPAREAIEGAWRWFVDHGYAEAKR
jgi:dihydroflavonol-4-reductase